jgi:NAD+ diphosphatase
MADKKKFSKLTACKARWLIFCGGKLLLKNGAAPLAQDAPFNVPGLQFDCGVYKQNHCRAFELKKLPGLAAGWKAFDLRDSFELLPERLFWLAGRAAQMICWDNNTRFCPACGVKTKPFAANAKICPACNKELYPVITPAVMVLVKKGSEILMVRGINFKWPHYGLVAGFLEAGETFEACASREVSEETGIKIKNIKYFGSRPWPFPSGIMAGFTADYAGGRLRPDGKELLDARFFGREALPPLPDKISLARRMVDAWLKGEI